jgi:hypothetical protein
LQGGSTAIWWQLDILNPGAARRVFDAIQLNAVQTMHGLDYYAAEAVPMNVSSNGSESAQMLDENELALLMN